MSALLLPLYAWDKHAAQQRSFAATPLAHALVPRPLQARMADPEVSGNNTEYQKLVRALTDIQDAVDAFGEYKDLERQLADAKELLRESESERGGGPALCWGMTTCSLGCRRMRLLGRTSGPVHPPARLQCPPGCFREGWKGWRRVALRATPQTALLAPAGWTRGSKAGFLLCCMEALVPTWRITGPPCRRPRDG